MDDLIEKAALQIPAYLTPGQREELYSELRGFPDHFNYYLSPKSLQEELLQGDGWRGFLALNFETGERKSVSGLVLSNSCDVSLENERALPVNILFSPLIRLNNYIQLLLTRKTEEQVDNIVAGIKQQRTTSIFYLPGDSDRSEYIVSLDTVHPHPLRDFTQRERSRLFRLSQSAFYLFMIKLSIHFTRFQEGVARFEDAVRDNTA